jgi:hypothetical protein
MPDVTPCLHPGEVRRWISFDQHKFSIVAAVLPPDGGKPEVFRIETTVRAIRRFIDWHVAVRAPAYGRARGAA